MKIQSLELDAVVSPEIRVLDYWHILEFFNPYNLDDATDSQTIIPISFDYLEKNKELPWHTPMEYPDVYYYDLYFLPFNKNELSKASRSILVKSLSETEKIEFEERFDDEGETCFATLRLTALGTVAYDQLSISTLPWALGQLQLGQFENFSAGQYTDDLGRLDQALNIIHCYVEQLKEYHRQKDDGEEVIELPEMQGQELLTIVFSLLNWAQFKPKSEIALYIVPKKFKGALNPKLIAREHHDDEKILVPYTEDTDEDAEEEETQIVILNSFFIDDLEKVKKSLTTSGDDTRELRAYILDQNQQRIDLYDPRNQDFIVEKLSPQYMNAGRWPSDPKQNMSLMQQLVIHEVFHPDNEHHLFSVNGPPGTGKTTLLQDIIAENIVKRATALAKLQKATDAFIGKKSLSFYKGEKGVIGILDPALLGFEMVVASSNNTAVENITKDLVLPKKIAQSFQGSCSYLASVARMAKAERKNNEQLEVLKPDAEPWGLISVALGNSKNRSFFKQQAFIHPEKDKQKRAQRIKEGQYLTMWEWIRHYQGLSFNEAKALFLEKLTQYQKLSGELSEFSALNYLLKKHSQETFCQEICDNLAEKKSKLQAMVAEHSQQQGLLNELELQKEMANQELQALSLQSPRWFEYIFNHLKVRSFNQRYQALHLSWIGIDGQANNQAKRQFELNDTIEKMNAEIVFLQKNLIEKQVEFSDLKNKYEELHAKFDSIILPPEDHSLENHQVQENAFWQCPLINQARSALFIAALRLHEAWLAESDFSASLFAISQMLDGNLTANAADELLIWQNFFMWIPVVSSTFASVARQFKRIGSKAFGWMLIDEAGQAIPQAAVGAIWRAQNIVIVGDPLQIEPVVTIPPPLIFKFAEKYLPLHPEKWMPLTASVQTLADYANRIGASIENRGQVQWIGCPLRVHRRCVDPMFEIANQIAYMGKMINARVADVTKSKVHACLGGSCWFDLSGAAIDKQYVEEQGQFILHIFALLYQECQGLPALYVITPFKKIKMTLQKMIKEVDQWQGTLSPAIKLPSAKDIRKWVRDHIGTVHTFQGKEKDAVIFVLGADAEHQGAINWAASKPNLLNVALTRAQNHFYVVGDRKLWGQKQYFELLANELPVKTLSENQENDDAEIMANEIMEFTSNMFIYSYEHIDLNLGFSVKDERTWRYFEHLYFTHHEDGVNKAFFLNELKAKLTCCGWEGDGDLQLFWVPPFIRSGDTLGDFIFHVKQKNNGTSWLASPVFLSFPPLEGCLNSAPTYHDDFDN